MKNKIRVTVSYYGSFRGDNSTDYKILKIIGAPTVEVAMPDAIYAVARVGDFISEKQATELATRVELTTLPREQ